MITKPFKPKIHVLYYYLRKYGGKGVPLAPRGVSYESSFFYIKKDSKDLKEGGNIEVMVNSKTVMHEWVLSDVDSLADLYEIGETSRVGRSVRVVRVLRKDNIQFNFTTYPSDL